jgi:Outer membrane protein beta-barrel domain
MKTTFTVVGGVLLAARAATADDMPKMETFLGYTYVRANSAYNLPAFSAYGGGGQFAYNFNRWLGAVADIGVVRNGDIGSAAIDNTTLNFLFGPRVSLRHPHFRPYFQVLWGGAYLAESSQVQAIVAGPGPAIIGTPEPGQPINARLVTSQTAFAMTAGGGLDMRLNKHVSFRPIAVDYYLTHFQNLRSQNDNSQNNFRYTTGFSFTFGAQ